MWLYYENRETLFKDVPEATLKEYLLNHDYEKLASIEELQQLGYNNKKTLAERLYEVYGENQSDNPKILPLVNELNIYGSYYDKIFFRKHGYLDSKGNPNIIAMSMMLIAKIADTVEREKDPVTPEELGILRTKKADNYFTEALEKTLVHEVAKNYHSLVPPHPLIYSANAKLGFNIKAYIVSTTPRAPLCQSLFN
jgi:hypothetical protein